MAGLDLAIHGVTRSPIWQREPSPVLTHARRHLPYRVDARVKPAHDVGLA